MLPRPEEGTSGPVVCEKVVQKVALTPIKGWPFWGRGSENHTFWPLFAPKMQLLLGAPSPNYTVQLIWVRPCFMWNGIPLAPREHTPALNPRCISANPSWCSSSETALSIFFKFTVHSWSVANLMHVKRQLFICIISNTFPSRFCPKSAIFGGWGHSNSLISVTVQCISMPFQI